MIPPRSRWQQALSSLGRAGCYLTLFLGWQVLVSAVYSVTIAAQFAWENPFPDSDAVMEAVMGRAMEISLLSGLLTIASVVIFFQLRGLPLRKEVWIKRAPGRVFLWGALLAFCLYWTVTLVMGLLPEKWLESYGEASESLNEAGPLPFLATALVAPVVEELIFRGLIFTRLRQAMPWRVAAALSALIFGACHGELVWFCYAFLLGLIFALVTGATGSILPSMVMHIVFNTTNELLTLTSPDWAPGSVLSLLIFLCATAGTAGCAVMLQSALKSQPPALPEHREEL